MWCSWKCSTKKQYATHITRWQQFCDKQQINPMQADVTLVLKFLSELFDENLSYSSLNTARSATKISDEGPRLIGRSFMKSMYFRLKNCPRLIGRVGLLAGKYGISQITMSNIGSHPLVVRFMRGVYNMRPSEPRYNSTWDVSIVLRWAAKLSPLRFLSLKQLTLKTVILLALVIAARGQNMFLLDCTRMKKGLDKFEFFYEAIALKQSRQGQKAYVASIPRFDKNKKICPYMTICEYLKRTKIMRGNETRFFISYVKPYKKVCKQTISKWVKQAMSEAGVDVDKYKPHSIRSAAASEAKSVGVPLDHIMKTAGWARSSTFVRFYNKDIELSNTASTSFQTAVLDCE
ncbi:uncharacterized protein LOC141908379 [Tubulanus polymorphus]|uniref:uncharacterized protein LOC141908379 n=1 Tax=Tubulanus polymorphus TaxID=672921 RepID=UPI003DA2769C